MYNKDMYDLVTSKWDEILNTLKVEHDILDVSFNTWIKPLKISTVEDNMVSLIKHYSLIKNMLFVLGSIVTKL